MRRNWSRAKGAKNPKMKFEGRVYGRCPGVPKLQPRAAKDNMTVEQHHKVRNHFENKYTRVRILAGKFAEEILK
jgi:hypothetical protein